MRKKKVEEVKEVKEIKEVKVEVPEFYMLGVKEKLSDVSKKFGISEEELIKLNGDTVIGGNQIKMRSN